MAKIIVPNPDFFKRPDGVYEPSWAPVFYNPRMKHNRDIGVLATLTYFYNREWLFIEPLAGCGVRSIRYVLESNGSGIVNDLDPIAYYYITRNIDLNNVGDKLEAYCQEANTLLNNMRCNGVAVDYIDVDPYGSPIPFIDSSVYAIAKGGLLAVTATDTAPLNCSHRDACLRKYHALCYKTDFSKEMGLRILIGSIVKRAASHGIALKPMLSYYRGYYYRAYFTVERSNRTASSIVKENVGYIVYHPSTLYRTYIKVYDLEDFQETVYRREGYVYIGPLWISKLGVPEFIYKILDHIRKTPTTILHLAYLKDFLKILKDEYNINNPYYRYDLFCGMLGKTMPTRDKLIESLREQGFNAVKTHFDPRGVKTNADYNEFIEILKSI